MPETEAPATNVVEALRRVMRDLPSIGKDQRAAREQGGYAYRGIEQITKEAQGLCARHGVVFAPRVVGVPEVVDIIVNSKPWTDTRMLVEYDVFCADAPGNQTSYREGVTLTVDGRDHITVGPIFAIGRDNSDKGANKCMTQAFKYALLQVFMIADAKDDADGTTHEADTYTREESGEPYRRATLRSVAGPTDVARMRTAELVERLRGAGLTPERTVPKMRVQLAAHLAGVSQGMPAPEGPSTPISGALEGTLDAEAGTGIDCFAEGCLLEAVPDSDYCTEHNG